jgi:hypothetical protein
VRHRRLGARRGNLLRVDGCWCTYWTTATDAGFDYTGIVDPVAVIDSAFPASSIDGVADVTGAVIENGRLACMGKTQRAQQKQDSVESFHISDPMIVIDYLNRELNGLWCITTSLLLLLDSCLSDCPETWGETALQNGYRLPEFKSGRPMLVPKYKLGLYHFAFL